jgi:hypothetical protein
VSPSKSSAKSVPEVYKALLRKRSSFIPCVEVQNITHVGVLQEWMLQEGVLDACKPLLQQPEEMDRRKGLLAISAIVRGHTAALVEFLKDPQLLACTLAEVCAVW